MKTTSTILFTLLCLIGTTLSGQVIEFPPNCDPPQLDITPGADPTPRMFAELQIDGAIAPTGSIVGVYNANGGLIGRGVATQQSLAGGATFTPVNVVLQTDDQGENCPVFTDGELITVVLENEPAGNLQAINSIFAGIVGNNGQGFITGPDNIDGNIDLFNFESRFLPVTFASLQARDLGGKVSIEWATASESGNDYFEVEHGTDVGSFSAIGQVAGAGDSQELLGYDLVHDNPIVGTNYYRIKQVDFEGTFSYSGIVPVEVAGTPSGEVAIFPNPAGDYFNLNVGNDWKVENVNVAVFNAQGRRIIEWTQSVEVTRQIFTDELPAGVYVLRVDGAQRSSTQRLVIE